MTTRTVWPPQSARLVAMALWVVVALWFLRVLSIGIPELAPFDGYQFNGVFQLYNALRRIGAGQLPGVDFPVFHGVGIPYLHYLVYWLLGSSFVAAEWSHYCVSVVLYPLSLFAFFSLVGRSRLEALALVVVALVITLPLGSLYKPLGSLLGVRAAAPLLAVSALMIRGSALRRGASFAGALALALLLGLDQAIALIGAVVLVSPAMTPRGERVRAVAWVAATVAAGIGIAAVILVAMCGVSGASRMVRYQFVEVLHDQMWYFGGPPNDFLATWADLWKVRAEIAAALVGIGLVVALWRSWRRSSVRAARSSIAMTTLLVYGILACGSELGYLDPRYATPLHRSIVLCAIALGYFALKRRRSVIRRVAAIPSRTIATLALLPILGCAMLMARYGMVIARALPGPELSPAIERDMAIADSLAMTVNPSHPSSVRVWSTYAGLFDARREVFQPSPDYIIHALGDDRRRRYVADFEAWSPAIVQTYRPTYLRYEEWLQVSTWPFYESLLRHYSVAALMSQRILWRRLSEPRTPLATIEMTRRALDSTAILLPEPERPAAGTVRSRVMQVVDVEYTATNPWSTVPVVGPLPRFLIDVRNSGNHFPVSLPPSRTSVSFPVYRNGGTGVTLTPSVASLLPGARLRIRVARVRTWVLTGADTIMVP